MMKVRRDIGLYVIIDRKLLGERRPVDVLTPVLDAGVKWVQYRDKHSLDRDVARALREMLPLCQRAGARLIVNDRLWLVRRCRVDGVHLGRADTPPGEATASIEGDKIIGRTARTLEEAKRAEAGGARYLGVGALFPSSTKPDAPLVGIERLREIVSGVRIPVVGIGGINRSNVAEVLRAGASGVAVCSAVMKAPDPAAAVRGLLSEIERLKGEKTRSEG